jgi:hypothetical protein
VQAVKLTPIVAACPGNCDECSVADSAAAPDLLICDTCADTYVMNEAVCAGKTPLASPEFPRLTNALLSVCYQHRESWLRCAVRLAVAPVLGILLPRLVVDAKCFEEPFQCVFEPFLSSTERALATL